jgi:hypothetical protein
MNVYKRMVAALLVAVLTACAQAAKPSARVVKAGLDGESHGSATWTAIATNEVGSDDDFQGATRPPSSPSMDERG